MKRQVLGIVILCLVSLTQGFAQTGILKGKITDSKTGEELIGAAIVVEGTTTGTTTDFMGDYTMPPLEPGTYTIRCQYISYESQVKEGIIIKEGEETTLNFMMGESELDIAEVQVVAKANRESENFLMLEQKEADIIVEKIGAKRMSNLGVSDAADATSKISGVTKNEGSGDVYIRGLGDRYLTTTMNGLPVPSDDVEKKNIDLNLFSTDVIKNIGINKTYDVSTYADQSSGAVDISSKTYSEKISIGISGGANTNVLKNGVFGDFRATQNINDQTLGFYSRPFGTKDAITKQSWNTETKGLPINYGVSVLGGKKIGDKFTLFATLSQSGSSEYQTGVFRSYRSNILDNSFNDVEKYITEYNTTGLLNLAYDFNINHSVNFNSMFIHTTKDELYEQGRNGEGYVFDQDPQEDGAFVRDQNLKETTLFINQLLGSHKLTDKQLVKWAVAYNMVNADEPNRIRNEVNILDANTVQFAHVGDYQQRKSLQEIKDSELNAYLKDEIKLIDEEGKQMKLNVGANFRSKTRAFESLFMGVRAKGVQVASIDNLDEALLDQSLYQNGTLTIRQGKPNTYDADLLVYSGFLNFGLDINKFSANVGARYEVDKIDINWDVDNYVGRIGSTSKSYNNILPALHLKYQTSEKSALRFSASKTITLPEFKELAPFDYVSPTGRVTTGNPELQSSENYNFDLKWERFPSAGQLLSVTGFYKMINDPINLRMLHGSSGYFSYANTGDRADVYGLEVESRVNIIKAETEGMPGLDLSVNLTKMWFNQDLHEEFQYHNKTETGLQGAAEFIANGSLTYSNNQPKELVATLTGNYSSDKIFALGAPEDFDNSDKYFNSEIIEKGFVTLDLIISKKLSDRVSLKFTGKNLLNPEIEQTQLIVPFNGGGAAAQSDEVVKSYKKGVSLSMGVSINLN
ncbi:TonB-dependent receptor [Carboxylicivirga mesophila]|uniref:TonB-dependent receptor n=1 Tax=Carboxylicivirga mesophila TaxID=1166478 RepID=A0ABS5K6G2_9BACT|nr:TonB-dependent receptor [Carboxylicivirga mesophila]MBS2210532.1 TonB-dependent receptor [Carboxylicivirga mesophila]